ncbi:IclR family transcriptional regulator [Aquabacter sp. P-9]|uniref:IclR family transcriptional regulator n=1 Tax=Aquabacter sediminis TaxID=3029197 RepID=UPI00237E0A72|nr:IclR family transcriptional regulator [Aquabacter sp. P-9]MDE1568601.1 IclR family transcriptional regulator [Aquabacter sp. P-9]
MSSLDKMLKVLDLFGEERMNIQLEDVQATGASRATAYRYIQSLCDAGLLAPTTGGSYVLGPRIIEMDRLVRRADPLLTGAGGPMRDVSARLGINVMLCSYYGDKVMCADIVWPERSVPEHYERGRPMPMFRGAMAKTILAHLTPYQLRNIMLWHGDQVREAGLGENWEQFRANMSRLRRDGYCITQGEVIPNLVGIGAPVFDAERRILGSVVFALPLARFHAAHTDALVSEIKQLAARITGAIAGQASVGPPQRAARPRKIRTLPVEDGSTAD